MCNRITLAGKIKIELKFVFQE